MDENAACLTCNAGYRNDGNGKCEHCNDNECCPANTSYCSVCSDDGVSCVECGRGYALVNGVCGYCEKGYVVVNSSCVKCGFGECCPGNTEEPTMSGCHECDNEQERCATCPIGTKLNGNGMCVTCGSDECCWEGNSGTDIETDCMSCTHDYRFCESCGVGYTLINGGCIFEGDKQALQDTISSLCSLNHEGHFGSCCESYDISSVTLDSSPARNCFISDLYSTSKLITTLFVFQLFLLIFLFIVQGN